MTIHNRSFPPNIHQYWPSELKHLAPSQTESKRVIIETDEKQGITFCKDLNIVPILFYLFLMFQNSRIKFFWVVIRRSMGREPHIQKTFISIMRGVQYSKYINIVKADIKSLS